MRELPEPACDETSPAAVPTDASSDARRQALLAFLEACGWGALKPAVLAGDASFRRYYRLAGSERRAVVMDAPPPKEDVAPYIAVSKLLLDLGFSAPEVLAINDKDGFLLIEDFGDDTYTRLLNKGADEQALYILAVDTLIELQRAVERRGALDLPPYDSERLLTEAALLVDWYAPAALGSPLPDILRNEYLEIWQTVLPQAALGENTLVLRDYHVDNLMLLRDRRGVRGCGLLDFQDAVCGPASYDLVSLLEDARRDVPAELRRSMIERYLTAFPTFGRPAFLRSAAILAAQRNCKILGIFTRLWKRDGKPGYLMHIPRIWRLLEDELTHPSLAQVKRWLDCHLPPAARYTPNLSGSA
jgi:N-acetylmuramate 1-kinase